MIDIKAKNNGGVVSLEGKRCGNLSDLTFELIAILGSSLTEFYENIDDENERKEYMDKTKKAIDEIIKGIQNHSDEEKNEETHEKPDGFCAEAKVIEIRAANEEEALKKLIQTIKEGNL